MNKLQKVLLGVALIASLLGLVLPRYQVPARFFGGISNFNDITLSGQLATAGIVNSSGTSVGGGSLITKVLSGTGTWDPGNILIGSVTSTEITASGIATGKPCFAGVGIATATTANVYLTCVAQSSTIKLVLTNATTSVLEGGANTGAAIDYPSLTVTWFQFQ